MSVKCLNLKDLYGKRYKIFTEESWEQEKPEHRTGERPWSMELRGKKGNAIVYPAGGNDLMVYVASPQTRTAIRKLGIDEKQCGEYESSFRFHHSRLPDVDRIVNLRKRRVLSQEQKEKAIKRLANWNFKGKKHAAQEPKTA